MAYRSLQDCLQDLERRGELVRVREEVDPYLEAAEIQRRACAARAPAILLENLKSSPFPAVCNLFGTVERARYILRHGLERVKRLVRLKADPSLLCRSPGQLAALPFTVWRSLPRRVRGGPALARRARIEDLPAIQCWPGDGGPFITLPQVYTEDPERPGVLHSNLGVYRIQLAGGQYRRGREVGLHYQIHRGIGVHHAAAVRRSEKLKVSIFAGGPPAHTFAAVMPLPEGLSELLFAGMLAGRRFRYTRRDGFLISTEADFCITGTIDPLRTLPEGPFGDHLGYYSLAHDFPVLEVHRVYHRAGAVWPFTVVGRPPQEDTSFGELIHEITAPLVPREIPGLRALRAVDEAGVHPLLLAIGSERYVAYAGEAAREPREILTQANALLGFGQCSLAKYLLIVAGEDDPELDIAGTEAFFRHVLERVDWRRDLHFQTRTTIDTLDYSGTGLNAGSKVVVAAAGPRRRELARTVPAGLGLPEGFSSPALPLPGVLVLGAPPFRDQETAEREVAELAGRLEGSPGLEGVPLVVLADDAELAARSLRNFLWVTFTRSNPSHDIHGVRSFVAHKHWGCEGPLVIDARLKPHHAPPLVEDPEVSARVDALCAPGRSLHGVL